MAGYGGVETYVAIVVEIGIFGLKRDGRSM